MTKVKAAVIQAGSHGDDTQATLDRALTQIADCAAAGAKIIVFPEAYIGGYPKGADFEIAIGQRTLKGRDEYRLYLEAAIPVPGEETRRLAEATAEAGVYATVGVIEREGGTLYCTALYFGPEGLLGKHRKLMPTAAERLCWGFGDGSTMQAVDTPWGKMGAVICWENYMPMLRMNMYAQDVAIYCAPTADDRDSWAATMRHIALEGRCFVLSACQYLTRDRYPSGMANRISDDEDAVLMRGGSVIISPLGEVLAGPDFSGETVLYADLDLAEIPRGKFDFDVAGHYARPDVFSLKVDDRPKHAVSSASLTEKA
ncbi:nitrilase-related carbon-nitrogen hydrolase [Pseudooceanicola sp. C21-150M6]|uniref:nitrilase-related carbon-nitrogen hydrolase n=1 Tax=Pseudooceanicola sp. C21-150M6 TaxID=3434355 RepID=UPI003D7F8301